MIDLPGKFVHLEEMKQYMLWDTERRDKNVVEETIKEIAENPTVKKNIEYVKKLKWQYDNLFDNSGGKYPGLLKSHEEEIDRTINYIHATFLGQQKISNIVPARSRAYASFSLLPGLTRPFKMDAWGWKGLVSLPAAAHVDGMIDAPGMSPAIFEKFNLGRHATERKDKYKIDKGSFEITVEGKPSSIPTTAKREILINNWVDNNKLFSKDALLDALITLDFNNKKRMDLRISEIHLLDPSKIDDVYVPFAENEETSVPLTDLFHDRFAIITYMFRKVRETKNHEQETKRLEKKLKDMIRREHYIINNRYKHGFKDKDTERKVQIVRNEMREAMKNDPDASIFMILTTSTDPNIVKDAWRKSVIGAGTESTNSYITVGDPISSFTKKLSDIAAFNAKKIKNEKNKKSDLILHDVNDIEKFFPVDELVSGLKIRQQVIKEGITLPLSCGMKYMEEKERKACLVLADIARGEMNLFKEEEE